MLARAGIHVDLNHPLLDVGGEVQGSHEGKAMLVGTEKLDGDPGAIRERHIQGFPEGDETEGRAFHTSALNQQCIKPPRPKGGAKWG